MACVQGETATASLDEAEVECVICFEELESRGGSVPLPCECRVAYCHHCWDRALAASMSACGRPLCPSCRTPMHVDFDATCGRLLFSRAPEGEPGEEPPEDDWRKRLYTQAKPMQIQLLQRYGARAASAEGGSAAAAPAAALGPAADAGGPAATEDKVADATEEPPRCVCGFRLTCTSAQERVMAFVSEAPMRPPPTLIENLLMRPPIVCDICFRQVDPAARVWTCENGRRTVLHAVAYDVCEACFAFHAYGTESLPDPGDSDSVTEDSEEYDGASSEEKDW